MNISNDARRLLAQLIALDPALRIQLAVSPGSTLASIRSRFDQADFQALNLMGSTVLTLAPLLPDLGPESIERGNWNQNNGAIPAVPTGSPSRFAQVPPTRLVTPPPNLRGGYGFLTDFGPMDEHDARTRIQVLVKQYGIREFQFYDWMYSYSAPLPPSQSNLYYPQYGRVWPNAWNQSYLISLDTILIYIDEIHKHRGRAWAYVQSVAAEEDDLADWNPGIFNLINAAGQRVWQTPNNHRFSCYFLNAAWADYQTHKWAEGVSSIGFDGIYWDTLGQQAGVPAAETAGVRAFLLEAYGNLSKYNLLQHMNFSGLAWWDPNLFANYVVAFPYAEVFTHSEWFALNSLMADPLLASASPYPIWGVMPFYPAYENGGAESQAMLERWADAPRNRVAYLVVGDNEHRLHNEYFPGNIPLNIYEKMMLQSTVPVIPAPAWL